jgi:flagellar motility protein MotE (MotC chaperone)
MSLARSSRIFATVAIALAGLGALKALDVAGGALDLFTLSEPAHAAEGSGAPPADPRGPLDVLNADAREAVRAGAAAEAPGAAAAATCPAGDSFAERSGLTLSELQVLRSLSQRRRDLDSRESSVVEREGLLDAAEVRVEGRIGELRALEGRINGLLGTLDEAEAAQMASLVALYSRMKSDDAARIFAALDAEVRLEVASRMTDQALAPILSDMSERDAAALTLALAHRHRAPDSLEALEARRDDG